MNKIFSIALAAATLAGVPGSAHAQSWGGWNDRGDDGGRFEQVRDVCSGDRAHRLEARLDHEVRDGDIDPRQADRIHAAIDQLENRQGRECRERDFGSIRDIAYRYDRIAQWIGNTAQRDRYYRGW
jgi:hypothetical protein